MNLNIAKKLPHGTNVVDIKVPPELEREIETGCEPLDLVAGGHFTPSCATLFTGMSGAGKTTLLMQAADSITAAGHVCLYNSLEEAPVQLAKTAKRLGLRHGFILGNDRLVDDIIEHARTIQRRMKGQKAKDGNPVQVFVIFDSLQTLDDGKYANGDTNSKTPTRCIHKITEWCKQKIGSSYGIGIVIGQVTKGGEFAGKNELKHAIDAHFHLRIDVDEKSDTCGKRLLEARKNRFGGGTDAVVLDMTSTGLRVSTNRF